MSVGYGSFGSSLRDLPRLRSHRRRRESSWDRTGGNADFVRVAAGATAELADIAGAGSINHIWMTAAVDDSPRPDGVEDDYLRRVVLRIFWDGSDMPSVVVPLGDFFGVGHARTTNFVSAPLQMSPEDGRGLNSFFHMPFARGARFEVVNECTESEVRLYFYIDYDQFDVLEDGIGRFHAWWNRQCPTDGVAQGPQSNSEFLFGDTNTDGRGNYTILEVAGRGHYAGCVLSITNLRQTADWNWYGEGDDMIFVDGEPFPPSLHGTGTEDYFNTAWCPTQAYHAPYHGITLPGGDNWSGQISYYRFHVEDPVTFTSSLRVTIEHGHANKRSDDLSSVAYWYHDGIVPGLSLAPVGDRLPRLGP